MFDDIDDLAFMMGFAEELSDGERTFGEDDIYNTQNEEAMCNAGLTRVSARELTHRKRPREGSFEEWFDEFMDGYRKIDETPWTGKSVINEIRKELDEYGY